MLIFETYKTCFSNKSHFISSKTNYIVTNNPNASSNDGLNYANQNVKYPLAKKDKNTEIKYDYNYIRSPINRYIAIYIEKQDEGNYLTPISTTLIKIENTNTNIQNMFKANNLLITDNTYNYKYSIKFLSDIEYQNEVKKQNDLKDLQRRYNLCVDNASKITSLAKAKETCSIEFKIKV